MSKNRFFRYNENTVFRFVDDVNYAVELAKKDLRIVRKMRQVADYFITEIDFAKSCNLKCFIVDYDKMGYFESLVNEVLNKTNQKDVWLGDDNFPYAALYFVAWMLPKGVGFVPFEDDGTFRIGVEIYITDIV